MAYAFRPNSLIDVDGTIVALVHVESISQSSKNEHAVIDKLQGDITFIITTVSGHKHTMSIKKITETYKNCAFSDNMHDTYLAILDRWIHLLGNYGHST